MGEKPVKPTVWSHEEGEEAEVAKRNAVELLEEAGSLFDD